MEEQTRTTPFPNSTETTGRARSATDNIRQMTEASKQLFEAGKQMTESLGELTERVEHATNVGSKGLRSPWLIAGLSVLAGTTIIMLSRKG